MAPAGESGAEPPQDGEYEARKAAALRRFERFFARAAIFSVAISAGGIAWSFFLADGAKAFVIGALGFGGLLLAGLNLVIRNRIRNGPKAPYLRNS